MFKGYITSEQDSQKFVGKSGDIFASPVSQPKSESSIRFYSPQKDEEAAKQKHIEVPGPNTGKDEPRYSYKPGAGI